MKNSGIPVKHNWNMDEKGNQVGGGWNGDGSKYIFLQSRIRISTVR